MAGTGGGDLREMNAVWLRWGGGRETDAEEEFRKLSEDPRLSDALRSLVAYSHTKPEEMEWRITTMRLESAESAERLQQLLVGLNFNAALRQSRSFGGSNPFTRTVGIPQKAVDAAGGVESLVALLKEHLEELDSGVQVAARPPSTEPGPVRVIVKFSTLGGVEEARGKVPIFLGTEQICDIQIVAQPLITSVGQTAIESEGPAGSANVDLDLEAIDAALRAFANPRKGRARVWQLESGGFCFRILPSPVGIELARQGFLVVNGQRFRLSLSYVANSAVSMGPRETRPSANSLLEQWLAA